MSPAQGSSIVPPPPPVVGKALYEGNSEGSLAHLQLEQFLETQDGPTPREPLEKPASRFVEGLSHEEGIHDEAGVEGDFRRQDEFRGLEGEDPMGKRSPSRRHQLAGKGPGGRASPLGPDPGGRPLYDRPLSGRAPDFALDDAPGLGAPGKLASQPVLLDRLDCTHPLRHDSQFSESFGAQDGRYRRRIWSRV